MPKRVSLKGKGADLFFGDFAPSAAAPLTESSALENGQLVEEQTVPTPIAAESATSQPIIDAADAPTKRSREPSIRRATESASSIANQRASEIASALAIHNPTTIEAIRKVVKTQGREVSFIRMSPEEKARVTDIVYTYKRQGQKTTETEINRIAINYLVLDYYEHGEQSVLASVLASLLA